MKKIKKIEQAKIIKDKIDPYPKFKFSQKLYLKLFRNGKLYL